jgi:hypothetical protein
MFVKASTVPKLSPERVKRESLITHLACSLLSDPMEAIGFLNGNNETLGGRPLDVATRSTAGYAAVEQANGLYKAEVIHRRGPWRSFETVEYATLEWVDWFNNRRLLAPIGNIPPAEAEERYYAMLDDTLMAA